jgi:predicted permease
MSAALVIEVMLPLVILVAAGGVWATHRDVQVQGRAGRATGPRAARVTRWPADLLRAQLNRLVLYVFAPALMFSIAASTRLRLELLAAPLLVAIGMAVTGVLLYWFLYRSAVGRSLASPTRAALLLAGTWGNIFYLGFPVVTFLYGPAAGIYPAFVDMLVATPLLWSIGVWIATRLGHAANEVRRESPLLAMLRLPPVWAFVLGVASQILPFDLSALARAAAFVGQPTIPVMMLVLGLSIPWRALRPTRAILVAVAAKLLLMPLVVWGLAAWWFGPLPVVARAAVVEATMPTMLMAILLADRFRLDSEAAALMIGWSTLLFWFTLPAWLWLIE